MTSKTTALISGASSAVLGFAAYVADMPTDTQDSVIGTVTNLFPTSQRGNIGAVLKAMAMLCMYTAIHFAAKSGPATPSTPPAVKS